MNKTIAPGVVYIGADDKELDLFETTLRIILNRAFIAEKVHSYYSEKSESEQQSMIKQIEFIVNNHFFIERY